MDMEPAIRTSWTAVAGAEGAEVSIFTAPKHGNQTRCEIYIDMGRPLAALRILSSARTCELLERRQSEPGPPSYVSTIRSSDTDKEGVFRLEVNIQSLCPATASSIVLRMLSLQQRGIFCLHALEIDHESGPQLPTRASAVARQNGGPGTSSQMEAVRELLRNAQSDQGQGTDSKQKLMASIARAALQQKVPASTPLFSALPDSLLRRLSNSDAPSSSTIELDQALLRANGPAHGQLLHTLQQDVGTSLANAVDRGENGQTPLAAQHQMGDGNRQQNGHEQHGGLADDVASKGTEPDQLERFAVSVQRTLDDALRHFDKQLERIMSKHLSNFESRLGELRLSGG